MGSDTFPMPQLIKVQLADFYQVSDPNSTETAQDSQDSQTLGSSSFSSMSSEVLSELFWYYYVNERDKDPACIILDYISVYK